MREKYGESYFFVAYILSELKKDKKDREFAEYLDTIPKSCDNFPTFYTDEELENLIGSPILAQINDQKEQN